MKNMMSIMRVISLIVLMVSTVGVVKGQANKSSSETLLVTSQKGMIEVVKWARLGSNIVSSLSAAVVLYGWFYGEPILGYKYAAHHDKAKALFVGSLVFRWACSSIVSTLEEEVAQEYKKTAEQCFVHEGSIVGWQ